MSASGNGVHERIVTIGGTFDTLHHGHKEYIRLAFEFATRVIIYVNSDLFIAGKKTYPVHNYQERVENLQQFLQNLGDTNQYQIKKLNSLEDLKKDYLENPNLTEVFMAIVSPEYYQDFLELNHAREALGLRNFLILVKQRTRDFQYQDISSTRVRAKLPCPQDLYIQSPLESVT